MEYTVSITYGGTIDFDVEADNEAEAFGLAMEEYSEAVIENIEMTGYTIEEQ